MANLCVVSNIPGTPGTPGAAGVAGTNGSNAFTTTTANFTVPAVNANVTVSVVDSSWMVAKVGTVGHIVVVSGAGHFEVQSKPSAVSVILKNLGYTTNTAVGTVIASGAAISPAGRFGTDGAAGASALNNISPTTTKGDLIADNGANSPNASVVRHGVGANGTILVADSTTADGLDWKQIVPNSQTDNTLLRVNDPAGTLDPAPLQSTLVAIQDDGSIQATGTGGNARGSFANDLQTERADAAQVASGNYSTIPGGRNNTASDQGATVGGGETNQASGLDATIAGGTSNLAGGTASAVGGGVSNRSTGTHNFVGGGSGNDAGDLTHTPEKSAIAGGVTNVIWGSYSFIGGGESNFADSSASGTHMTIGGGFTNIATGIYSTIPGGKNAKTTLYGELAYASGCFSAAGDCQRSWLEWRNATTNNTQTQLFLDGSAAVANIPASTSWRFKGSVVGRRDNGDTATWDIEGTVKNAGGVATLVGAVGVALVDADAGCAATWGQAANIVVDVTAAQLRIRATGDTGNNIRWNAYVEIGSVTYA